jgi:hypothetical protein
LVKLMKWMMIYFVAIILMFIHWIAFAVFVLFLVWRSRVKKNRQFESPVRGTIQHVKDYMEEFEVVGITDLNEDGKSRQDVLIRCYRGDLVTLQYVPTESSPHRVEVWTKFGMIGYMAPYDVAKHNEFFETKESPTGVVKKMTGGTEEKPAVGCMIALDVTLSR